MQSDLAELWESFSQDEDDLFSSKTDMKLVRKREGDTDLLARTGDLLRSTKNIKINNTSSKSKKFYKVANPKLSWSEEKLQILSDINSREKLKWMRLNKWKRQISGSLEQWASNSFRRMCPS